MDSPGCLSRRLSTAWRQLFLTGLCHIGRDQFSIPHGGPRCAVLNMTRPYEDEGFHLVASQVPSFQGKCFSQWASYVSYISDFPIHSVLLAKIMIVSQWT